MDDALPLLPGDPPAEVDDARVEEIPPAREKPGLVPLSAMLDEREKRQALERELAEARAKAAPPAPLEPTEQLKQALYAQNLKVSRKFAERQYGAETMTEVHDWAAARCDADPHFNQQMRDADDPYEAAYQAFTADRVLRTVKPDRLDAFLAWEAAQADSRTSPSDPNPSPTAIPRSLSTAPGNGAAGRAHVPVGEGEAYGSIFT